MKNITNKQKILLSIIAIAITISITAFSYAYFTATIINKSTPGSNVVTSGTMAVEYDEGQALAPITGWVPGNYIEKTFSVENKGNVTANYDIYINEVVNTFVDKNDLVYTLTSNDGGRNINQTVYPSSDAKIASDVEIGVGVTHHYTLRITFIETNTNQNDNLGATFSGKVELKEGAKTKEITYKYTNSDGSQKTYYDTPAAFSNATGSIVMIKSKLEVQYLNTDKVYGILGEGHLANSSWYYNSLEECEDDIQYSNPSAKATCYEHEGLYYIRMFELDPSYITEFISIGECQSVLAEWGNPTGYQCALKEEFASDTKYQVGQTEVDGDVCYYLNNTLTCVDGLDYDWSDEEPAVSIAYRNAHPTQDCNYQNGVLTCYVDDQIRIEFQANRYVGIGQVFPKYSPRVSSTTYDTLEECQPQNYNGIFCTLNGNKYYQYNYSDPKYDTLAECQADAQAHDWEPGCGFRGYDDPGSGCSKRDGQVGCFEGISS